MRNILLILSAILFSASAWTQELTLQGRVVDAQTGEVLPYATVYVSEGRGALTNADGEFILLVSSQDMLTFSHVGYEKLHIKASELPQVIKLKMFEKALQYCEAYKRRGTGCLSSFPKLGKFPLQLGKPQ